MGAFARSAEKCTFDTCKIWGVVRGADNTGGIVGEAIGCSLTDCLSLADVSGDGGVGGLVGYAKNCSFKSCAARGIVSGRSDVGGFVGYCADSELNECQALGTVTGGKNVGGFVGDLRASKVIKCSARGKVTLDASLDTSKSGIGGFAGYIGGRDGAVSVLYCIATGAVFAEGASEVGGFVGECFGETETTKLERSYASGSVVGGTIVGGFAGSLGWCSVFNCYSVGSATAKGDSAVSSSYNISIDTGSSAFAGGFAGSATYEGGVDCRFCYASGYVKASTSESSVLNIS